MPDKIFTASGTKLISKKEACRYLGVSMYILNTLIKDKAFPVIRIGTGQQKPRVFIDRSALDQWIEDQKAIPGSGKLQGQPDQAQN